MSNPVHATTALSSVKADMLTRNGRHYARYRNLLLSSAYQPLFSFAHGRAVGYEALLRAQDAAQTPVSPLQVFATPNGDAELVHLDRLCRALHLSNHPTGAAADDWLFLNVNPRVVVEGKRYGPFFTGLLESLSIAGHRLVIEILEGEIHDEAVLAEALNYYRELGCLIAIDDFGAGHSNFERIWRLSPDIVKLDRSMIVQAVKQARVRRILPGLVALLHEAGCLVTMEGVETETEALIAMDADADLVQGYYFARPSPDPIADTNNHPALTTLGRHFRELSTLEASRQRDDLTNYLNAFSSAAGAVRHGTPLESACAALLAMPRVERCYLLDAEGVQIGTNLTPDARIHSADPRFKPLTDTRNATWFRRPYFRRAMAHPGEVQITRPYLSLTGARICITLSIVMPNENDPYVLCCDLECCTGDKGAGTAVVGNLFG
jgi:EAL domain-containing protein (putative c-di-GMP-specific phosphodiesterase class I)